MMTLGLPKTISGMRAGSAALLLALPLSCGGGSDDEDPVAPTVYGTMTLTDAPTEFEAQDYSLTKVSTCTNDATSGLFQANLSSSDKGALAIKIKGFQTRDSTYTCSQASDNADGEVGQLFDSCMVEVTTPSGAEATTTNVYAMHRDVATDKAFAYEGACSLTVSYAAPRVTMTVDCASLVQTDLEGAARNPIDETVTIDVASTTEFYCDL